MVTQHHMMCSACIRCRADEWLERNVGDLWDSPIRPCALLHIHQELLLIEPPHLSRAHLDCVYTRTLKSSSGSVKLGIYAQVGGSTDQSTKHGQHDVSDAKTMHPSRSTRLRDDDGADSNLILEGDVRR